MKITAYVTYHVTCDNLFYIIARSLYLIFKLIDCAIFLFLIG